MSMPSISFRGRLVSRHGPHLAVGVGSVRSEVLVGDLRGRVSSDADGLPRFVVSHRRLREVRSLRRGGRRHCCRRAGAVVRDRSSRRGREPRRWSGGQPATRSIGRALWRPPTPTPGGVVASSGRQRCLGRLAVRSLSVRSQGRPGRGSSSTRSWALSSEPRVQLIAVHSFVETALRPARVAIAGDTGIGDSLPRSRPTFAAWSNVSMLAVAFAFAVAGAMLAAVFDRTPRGPGALPS